MNEKTMNCKEHAQQNVIERIEFAQQEIAFQKLLLLYKGGTYHNIGRFDFLFLRMRASHCLLNFDRSSDFSVYAKRKEYQTAVWEQFRKQSLEYKVIIYNVMLIYAQICRPYRCPVILH